MSDEGTRRSRMGWIGSVFHPERKIASPTLLAIKAMLSGRRTTSISSVAGVPATAGPNERQPGPVEVALQDVPDLKDVGGIARVAVDSGETVGIARVGRTSFVGYRLEQDVLREIEVDLDEATGRLRIVPEDTYPTPPAA